MTWTISGRSKSACPAWGQWWASTPIGIPCISAGKCTQRTWINRTRGNSRTFGWFERIADRGPREGGRTSGQLDTDLIVDDFAHEAASQGRIHADVAPVHIEFVRADDAVPAQFARTAFDLHPGPKVHSFWIAPFRIRHRIDDRHALEPLAQEAHAPVYFMETFFAVGVLRIFRSIALRRSLGTPLGP